MDERTDSQLVAACRKGDREAYESLVRRHSRYIYAICLGILGSPTDSEDMTQEVFVKGFTRLGKLREDGQFLAWIAQIARNQCRDFVKVHSRRRTLLEQQIPIDADESADFHELHTALARLPETYRLPLMLYYFDGQSSESVARALNISQAGACTRLSRARRELRKLLEKEADR